MWISTSAYSTLSNCDRSTFIAVGAVTSYSAAIGVILKKFGARVALAAGSAIAFAGGKQLALLPPSDPHVDGPSSTAAHAHAGAAP